MAVDQSQPAATTAPDRDQIVRVVQLYIDGFNDGDIAKFREAFHLTRASLTPTAMVNFTVT